MKRYLTALLCATMWVAAPCFAQNAGPFTDVPTDHLAYQAVETLRQAGIMFGSNEPNRRYTRREFAQALVQMLHGNLWDLNSKFQQTPDALKALDLLADNLAPELQSLHADVSARTALDDLNQRLPDNDPAYGYVDTLQKIGIPFGYPEGTYGGNRIITRYTVAIAIVRLMSQFRTGDLAVSADLVARLQKSPPALNALNSLINEFAPELKLLGDDVTVYQSRLAALMPQFPDVPKNHWAANAVLTLRQNGIVQGYPQKTYTTPGG